MLGLEIKRGREGGTIHILQCLYIDFILRCFHLNDLKPLSTPMDTSFRLTKEQAPVSTAEHAIMCHMLHCEAIDALNWMALTIHPDITFAIATIACFTSNPSPAHWEAVKQNFCCLTDTQDLWLSYKETKRALKGYANTDGSMAKDRHAITGYAFLINSDAISWSFKHQEIISFSTTKCEYAMATHGMKGALGLHSLLSETFGPITVATTCFHLSRHLHHLL